MWPARLADKSPDRTAAGCAEGRVRRPGRRDACAGAGWPGRLGRRRRLIPPTPPTLAPGLADDLALAMSTCRCRAVSSVYVCLYPYSCAPPRPDARLPRPRTRFVARSPNHSEFYEAPAARLLPPHATTCSTSHRPRPVSNAPPLGAFVVPIPNFAHTRSWRPSRQND